MNELETLRAAVRVELELLWGDLDTAKGQAINGEWSMRCDSLVERIKDLTRLVGPTPWDCVGLSLLENGTYQRVHAELGVEATVDMGAVAGHRAADAERYRSR